MSGEGTDDSLDESPGEHDELSCVGTARFAAGGLGL